MSYSIQTVLHDYADKNQLHQVLVRVIYNRKKTYSKTGFKVKADQFKDGKIINHPHKVKINATINKQVSEIEERLIDMIRTEKDDTIKEVVSGKKKDRKLLSDFIREFAEEVKPLRSKSTIQVYNSLAADIDEYDPKLYLDKVSLQILNNFTKQQAEKWEHNTVNKKVKHLKAFLNRAYERSLIELDQFKMLQVPNYIQKLPTYITEDEMADFKTICDSIKNDQMKTSGYYFLLSCYAGYRISDLTRFNYKESVKANKILLTAKKNKEIISMPIHSRLKDVLNYCKDHPLNIAEQTMREYVKQIAKLAGIKKDLRVHDGRHSFAMMLMDRGFDLEEVAELLGITAKVAKVYARVSNKRLEEKVLSKLG